MMNLGFIGILLFSFGCSSLSQSRKSKPQRAPVRGPAAQNSFYNPNEISPVGPVGGISGEPGSVNYADNPNLRPEIKRLYQAQPKRMKKDDFNVDKGKSFDDGSLWAEKGQVNYLFTENRVRNVGDIVTIKVQPDLRKDIVDELRENALSKAYKRRLDYINKRREKRKKLLSKQAGSKNSKLAEKGKEALDQEKEIDKEEQTKSKAENDKLEKESDIILAEVVDRYANGSYRLRGIKDVVFRGKRRSLEVAGLVQDKDIQSDSSIKSDDMMNPKIRYLR